MSEREEISVGTRGPGSLDAAIGAEILARCARLGLEAAPIPLPSGAVGIRAEPLAQGCAGLVIDLGGEAGRHGALLTDPSWRGTLPIGPWHAGMAQLRVGDALGEATRLAAVLAWALDDLGQREDRDRAIGDFCEKLSQSYEETHALFRAMRLLASGEDPLALIASLCAEIRATLHFRWLTIHFGTTGRVVESLRGKPVHAGDLPLPQEALDALAWKRLAGLGSDSWTKVLMPGRDPIATAVGGEIVGEPITHDSSVIGLLLAGGRESPDGEVGSPEVQFLDAVADFLGTFHENLSRLDEQRAMMHATLRALVAAIDAKDRYTCGHSERVAAMSHALAIELGFDSARAERVRLSGLVHDVGKIGVPESILCKPGRPTDEEFVAIRQHPTIGYRILQGITGFEDLLPGVLHHHERWDGRGYPDGLVGEDIPLIARIIGVADSFDAMSSNRAYRAALPRERVLEEIARGAGSQFDPAAAAAFRRLNLAEYDRMLADHAASESGPPRALAA